MTDSSRRVVLVTGGASGIGAACVRAFAADGDTHVVVADLNVELAGKVAGEFPGQARAVPVDVTSLDGMHECVADVLRTEGQLDVAVNNAGVSGDPALLHQTSAELLHRVMAVNFFGVFHGMHAELAPMIEAGGGVVVNIASLAAAVALPFASVYTASKHAVLGLTRTAAAEYAASGIRVVAVCPGTIDTPITSHLPTEIAQQYLQAAVNAQLIKRLGRPEEVAALIRFLASAEASFITGSAHFVDGGYTTV
jgi:NAD(P)-dependent dehydrogenase (short-subunit alcohol dehydrogenase family)